MKPSDEILITRFVDGELDPSECAAFEARLESEPDLREAVEAASNLGLNLREVFAGGDVVGHDLLMAATSLANTEIPNPDAFNAQILGRIAG